MANPSPFATNAHGVQTSFLDFADAGAPTSITYHGASIVIRGNIVGRLQSWQPAGAYTREGDHVYELSHLTAGLPVDYVPGRATGFTVSFARNEVWDQELERVLGYSNVFNSLVDQTRPFEIQEFMFKGNTPYRIWEYRGCWLRSKNADQWEATGNFIHKITCELAYVSRIRTL